MNGFQASPSATTDDGIDNSRVYVKRPPEDDEPFNLERAPPKRQAFEHRATLSNDATSPFHVSSQATAAELQPLEKSPEDLVSIIHQMEASHAQQMKELRDQYTAVSIQLEQLKSLLNSHLTSQLGSIHLLQSVSGQIKPPVKLPPTDRVALEDIASLSTAHLASRPAIVPPEITTHIPKTPLRSFSISNPPSIPALVTGPASVPAPHYTQAARTPQRESLESPLAATPNASLFSRSTPDQILSMKGGMKVTPSSVPNEPPTVEPSHIDTVPEVWEEFRYGKAGIVSVEKLDALWGPRWRQEPKLRTWYQRRKVISDRIKLYMADGISEQDAVMEVEKMRRGRTLNWVSRILLDDRKETRKQRKVAAQAATAAKEALHGVPAT